MNHDAPPSTDEATDGSCDESEVARVFDAYLADLEAGRPVDPARLLADHPDIAEQLRACLDVMHLADQMANGSGAAPAEPRTASHSPAPGTSQVVSLLTSLGLGSAEIPQVLLRELPDEPEPLLKPRSAAMLPNGAGVGRFQLQGEIARGGMGAILKGRDVDLGRDLAIKVLLESQRDNPEVVRRFVEEAQIGGQLQHPGVVPVYELGAFPDHRPFFAMKLVKGRTLAALLSERMKDEGGRRKGETTAADESGSSFIPHFSSFSSDLPRFLSIFEQVCQTMAYSHARGVIHRDLKPSNVMVGSFGEVQVMDWGLAKVLPQGGIADEGCSHPVHETVIMTVRSGSSGTGSESQAGSVLGTPAYMAPEQARGEVERIDERADVFGLGAILCEVLTGQPPFVATSREEIRAQAARGDLADALGRLEQCAADAELIELARICLRSERDRRPRNAGEVAGRITTYLVGVQERLNAAELGRVEAQTRAEEAQARAVIERSRRRRTVALAASVLITAGVIGGGWFYLARQRTARLMETTRVVTEALAEAERLRGHAQTAAVGDLTKWSEAVGAAKRARDSLAEGEVDHALHNRVIAALAGLEREQTAAQERATELERDRKLLSDLESIRGNISEHGDRKRTDAEYAAAFSGFGIDLDRLSPAEAGKRLAQRSAPMELASHLDEWALRRRSTRDKKDETSWRRLLAAAKVADPDPWRGALRDQIGRADREALQRLAADPRILETQPARSLVLLASALSQQQDRDRAEQVLRRAWRLDPGDFLVNFELGTVYRAYGFFLKPDEATRFLSAAVAIRPRSDAAHNTLGHALISQGKVEEAIAEFREAIRLKPDDFAAHNNLGATLCDAIKDYAGAVAEFREALRLEPDFPNAHDNLGVALIRQGNVEEAIAEHREAIRLEPDFPYAHNHIGWALCVQGKLEEGIAEFREALRLKPDFPFAHNNLGKTLRAQGKLEEAIAEFRKARDLARTNPDKMQPDLVQQIERELTETEREASLAPRLPAVLSGKLKPVDAAEMLDFARLCYDKKLQGASAKFWSEAFQARPTLAGDMQVENRYNAACAAALAGCGQGKDEPPLDEPARALWRKQAIDWVKAGLTAWAKILQSAPPQARQAIAQTLQGWKADSDLASIRDPAALAKLPADEQNACRALWAEVDALLAKARNGQAQPSGPPASDSADHTARPRTK
jgi:serine/threonine-protein kinase